MLVLRIVGFLLLITIGGSLLMYLFTRNRRYLTWAWRTFQFALVVVIVVMILYVLERLVML